MVNILTSDDVRDLAARGRVAPASNHHAHRHGIRFNEIVAALQHCYRVREDDRTDESGDLRHPSGYVAWCPWKGARILWVDLVLGSDDEEDLLLVVTAMEVT